MTPAQQPTDPLHPNIRKDVELLKKYYHGAVVDLRDRSDINRLCCIGMMNTGVIIERRLVTAKTAGIGLRLLEKIGEVPI